MLELKVNSGEKKKKTFLVKEVKLLLLSSF